ncbi:hypothetical protein [Marixanthomonas spongiae]|uniref:Uncharacterized protein n=1 Tax=Marixanthomonas spongiae TaxID=2174845 RepID=A0A2U0I0W1_9FLAO|nr:hypothetical protein [Marixanthomonas spongiae]PVW14738.1 hypothetical protein DDV96_09490 [Marixanthomonas spongiae]
MELAKIEKLLDAYFEGNTTLAEEAMLRDYFAQDEIAPQVAMYQPLFVGLVAAKEEVSDRELKLPKNQFKIKNWWYAAAASVVLAIGVAGFVFSEPKLTQEEQEALAAFEKTKEAMQFMSKNFNKGAEELTYISTFTETKNKILK